MSTLEYDLYDACRDGNVEEVKRLLAAGADENTSYSSDETPLSIASQFGRLEIVQILLDHGADIAKYRGQALYFAAESGHDAIVDLLALQGANVDVDVGIFPPLIHAAIEGSLATVETLVVFGVNIDSFDNVSEETALMKVVRTERIEALRLLLSLNADATKVDRDGKTAFQLADIDVMKQLFLDHEKKTPEERKQLREETLTRLRHKVNHRLMRFAQDTIIDICLAMSSLELPPYVLLWIIDFLPYYDKLSHHKKIELITSVRDSIWKIQKPKEVRQRFGLRARIQQKQK